MLMFASAHAVAACADGGAASGSGPIGSSGKADGPGAATTLARCWIDQGAGTATATDMLRCAKDGASGAEVLGVEVTLGDGRTRALDLADADQGEIAIASDAYPLTLALAARIDVGDAGDDAPELSMTQLVARPEDLATARAFFAPYDLWAVVVDNQIAQGDVGFDARALFLEGAEVVGSADATVFMPPVQAILSRGETRTFVIPVTRGTTSLVGAWRDLSATDALTPFTLDHPGRYSLTAEGLLEGETAAPPPAPPTSDGAVVRCGSFDLAGAPHLTCYVVARPGITFANVTATVDGVTATLPDDGTVVDLGALRGSASVAIAAQLASGIDGLGRDLPPLDGALVVVDDGAREVSIDFPFDLLHIEVDVDDDVQAAMFDGPNPHVVAFSRPWGGMDRSERQLRRRLGAPTDRNVWIAVSAGVTEVAGEVAVFETETPERYPTTLADGQRWSVTRSGLMPR